MSNVKDISGDRFGVLTARSMTGEKVGTSMVWLCECDCGNLVECPLYKLRRGTSKSCGCLEVKGKGKDVQGSKFNKLTAISSTGKKGVSGDFIWECLCECGNSVEVPIGRLSSGSAYSCGCSTRMGKHNRTGTPTYTSWVKMLQRARTDDYGDWYSDVTVCPEWDTRQGGSFKNFLLDMGERPEGMTLNRVNGAKVYSKENCEWADTGLQSYDQRKRGDNTSGRTGVRWRPERLVWESKISVEGKQIILYYGVSWDEAVKAREEAELKYYGFNKE